MDETSVTFLLALIFLSTLKYSRSSAVDPYYEACKPSKCGVMNVINYPFFEATRQPSYCGEQGFEIVCRNGQYPTLNLSGDWYNITNISYEYQSVQVVNYALLDTNSCPSSIHSLTLGSRKPNYLYSGSQGQFLLLRNCSNEISQNVSSEYKFDCGGGETIAVEGTYINRTSEFGKLCKGGVVIVPYQKDEEVVAAGQTDIKKTLAKGVSLNWEANNCSRCEEAGGRCGYLESTSEFKCFCPDRPHNSFCRPNEPCLSLAGIIILVSVVIVLVSHIRRRGGRPLMTRNARDVEAFLRSNKALSPKRFTYSDIKKITLNFKEKLGQGGYGKVYKGNLLNGCLVAVKLLNQSSNKDGQEFINEVASISRTNHVNIVTLLGFCFEGRRRALIYEFMKNGSLEKFIGGRINTDHQRLPLETLFKISLGIARGLEYLHRGCNMRMVHFDIKPHNILLDEEFNPKVSDFGLCKLYPDAKKSELSMLEARGTIGYIAPEVISRNIGNVSHKSDVYSYGMMLLDVLGSKKAANIIDENGGSSYFYFPDWIYKQLQAGEELEINVNEEEKELQRKMTLVSLWCIQTVPSHRPSMNRVIQLLEGSVTSIEVPPAPAFASPPRSPPSSSTFSTQY